MTEKELDSSVNEYEKILSNDSVAYGDCTTLTHH